MPSSSSDPSAHDEVARANRAANEMVEVVSPDGSVIDVVTRAEMRAGNLRHRCTFCVVLAGAPPTRVGSGSEPFRPDQNSRLWVHQRAAWKDSAPLAWDIAFGGVCGVGEGWRQSAERELEEEAGVTGVPLIDLGQARYEDEQTRIVGRAFITWWRDELTCPDGEVVAVELIRLDELKSWLLTHQVCQDSAAVLSPILVI